ncbi:TPA: endonuclease [Candidatus Amesbacteria bacterium]|nr:endonuclease [Candidatus Amesbacteria bacterium]
MFYTYILRNTYSGRHYIGSTNDISRRLSEHNRGQNISTRRRGEWILIYKEEYSIPIEAKQREKVLKSYKGGNAMKRLLGNTC